MASLDQLSGNGAPIAPANLFIGVSSTAPAEDGSNVTEPTAGSYARVSRQASDWTVSADRGDGYSFVASTTPVTFPTATADWLAGAPLTHTLIFDAATAGNLLFSVASTTPKINAQGQVLDIAVGDLSIALN